MALIIHDGDAVRSSAAFVRRTMEGSTTPLGYYNDPSFYSAAVAYMQDQSLARIVASPLPVAVSVGWGSPMPNSPPILKRGIFMSQEAATRYVDLYVRMSAGQEFDLFDVNFRHAHDMRVAGRCWTGTSSLLWPKFAISELSSPLRSPLPLVRVITFT